MKYIKTHWWDIVFVCALVVGFGFGIWRFTTLPETGYKFGGAMWETIRLFDREYGINDIPAGLAVAQWLLLFAFLWISLKVILTIIAPELISNLQVRLFYRNHIVICGSGSITSALIDGNKDARIIVLAECENEYTKSLKHRGVKIIFCGERFDEHFLQRAKTGMASRVWIATGDDRTNVEVTKSVFSQVTGTRRREELKCYTIVEDRELKQLLSESRLFKYRTEKFDPLLLCVDETGLKYALGMNIERILSPKPEAAPEILVAGLTRRSMLVILDLAHCLTMTRQAFRFTVAETDPERIASFKKRYPWLSDFAEIEYVESAEDVCSAKRFDSIFVCSDSHTEAVKMAIDIRNAIGDDHPCIFILGDSTDSFAGVLELEERHIFWIDTFSEAVRYVVELNPLIELHASAAHDCWRTKDTQGDFTEQDEYCTLSAHFKQSNRSQVLDNYLRAWLATGNTFDTPRDARVLFPAKDMETLAMMEHRRWMIEKLDDGWKPAEKSNNRFKRRSNLVPWNELSDEEKAKDYNVINLMVNTLNNR